MSLTTAAFVAGVLTEAAALSGINAAPSEPPESLSVFPVALCYPTQMTVTGVSAGLMRQLVTVKCDLIFGRQLLPLAVSQAMPYGDSFSARLINNLNLSGAVDHINTISATFGLLTYGSVTYIGWSFEITAKIEAAV